MALISADYIGRDVYIRDGEKIGEVKKVLQGDYLLIDRTMAHDVVVPFRVMDQSADRLVLPYTKDFVDDSPDLDLEAGRGLSVNDRRIIDDYYLRRAA